MTVTTEDLRELLEAAQDMTLVVEEGEARIVPDADAAPGTRVMARSELLALLGGEGADTSDETLEVLASGLGTAVREQVG